MPELSGLYRTIIRMYFADHARRNRRLHELGIFWPHSADERMMAATALNS